jgi:hypothetical protein
MNRLQRELQRLYAPQANPLPDLELDAAGLVDAQGRVRAMVLELARPADWAALSAVWGGVQADLALPAPAIAVNGRDGFQLWFSLLEPVPAMQAGAFLDALRRRYLGDIAPARVAMLPTLAASSADLPGHARPVPALQADSGLWSVFVASDLVPVFTEAPGLEVPPNPDGQAQLLAPLKSMTPAEFDSVLKQLGPAAVRAAVSDAVPDAHGLPSNAAAQTAASLDARRFLLAVMNDQSLDLALRIEAAKALLPGCDAARGP